MAGAPIFITGTDTGVGKTVVAAHLVRQLREAGQDAVYWKPIETGIPDGQSLDLATVRDVCGPEAPAFCETLLPDPLAPNVAARRAGVEIDPDELDVDCARFCRMYGPVVIEGAGGLLVHVTDDLTFADFAQRWQARVLLVVANRLGCLNHATLTVRELERRELEFGGWVLNHPGPETSIATETNAAELTRLLGPPLAVMMYGEAAAARLIHFD